MKPTGVVIGMSGGIDSSAALWMLHARGYRVCGVTVRFTCYARSNGVKRPCCSDAGLRRARELCARLGAPHHTIDAEEEFTRLVIGDFIEEYRAGRTPNPCIVCNEKVKFPALARAADWLGFERIATGHYARIVRGAGGARYLASALDERKDQSYFLYRVPVKLLDRSIFPLGDLTKESVKAAARRCGFHDDKRRESQDICFLPGGRMDDFLRARIGEIPGEIVDEAGRVLGSHRGAYLYTIGQRKGLGVAGGHPLYVAGIDPAANRIVLAREDRLYGRGALCGRLKVRGAFFGCEDIAPRGGAPSRGRASIEPGTRAARGGFRAKIRYRRVPAEVARIERRGKFLAVQFHEPQWAVTPGQSLVLYRDGIVAGGGIIEKPLEAEGE